MFPRFICTASLCAVLSGCASLGLKAATPIAKDGQAIAVIVHNGHTGIAPALSEARMPRGVLKPAVEELRSYLKQITGAELPLAATIAEAGDRPAIVLELVDRVPGASNRATGQQAFRIKTEGNRLVLTAATPLGLRHAVYGLLEDHLGCRFYTYRRSGLRYVGPGHHIVPQRATLTLLAIDDLQEPAFANRGLIYQVGSYPWVLKNRGIGMPAGPTSGALAAGHNLYSLLPPRDKKVRGKLTKGLFAEHPGFYPVNSKGERQPTWSMGVCGTNKDIPHFLAKGILAYVEQRTAQRRGKPFDFAKPIPAAQGDGFTGCQCDPCRQLAHEQQSEAAPLILMLNRALDELNKTHPDLKLITFAYFQTLDAPKTLKPHKNLWINVVSSSRSQNPAGDQMGPIPNNPANRDYARALREWPKIAPGRVTVWNWDSYRAEWPSVFYVAENVRYLRDCGVYGVNPQFCGGPWRDLLSWVYLRLAWNPDADADALIRQFLEDNYGKAAAPHLWNYHKLMQAAYADSCLAPSAVRWSGWTPTTRQKLFPPTVLNQMIAAMDKALAAATAAGDKAQLDNLIGARGQSLDVVVLDAAKSKGGWGSVRYQKDGRDWYVAGGDARVPACLDRAKQGIVVNGGGEPGVMRTICRYATGNGGPVLALTGKAMQAVLCPELAGQIISAVDKRSGKELLAIEGAQGGYRDMFRRISAQIWLPMTGEETGRAVLKRPDADWATLWSDFANPHQDRLKTELVLSPKFYGFYPTQYLHRTVSLTDNGLRLERAYTGGLVNPGAFSTRWRLALPEPAKAKVAVQGGGLDQLLDLRYAVPGGIKGVKAGDRLPGMDAMDERFDTVIAVSDAKVITLQMNAKAGDELVLRLDRGDGVAAVLTTPAAGWKAIQLKPVIDKNFLEITLVGKKPKVEGDKAEALALPVQSLSAKAVPVAKGAAATGPVEVAQAPTAKIKRLGQDRAVNEIDGTEMVWIPAGEFLRGSPDGKGASDERPQRKVRLDGYWIYKLPVTLAQYTKYCEAVGKEFKPTWGQGMHANPKGDPGAYPALMNWYEAADYAKWVGGALPSEAQWEKAARGTDGREYPWGNAWDPEKAVGLERTVNKFSAGNLPVGSSPAGASPYGVEDMAGNCWEWVADWYEHEYYRRAPASNPLGPETGTHKVLRGGDSMWDERFSRAAARMINPPHVRNWVKTAFRVVVAAAPE